MTVRLLFALCMAFANADHELPSGISPDKIQTDYSGGRVIRTGETFTDSPKPPCEDMSSAACSKTPPKDPTGKVIPALDTVLSQETYDRQKKALQGILETWSKLDPQPERRTYVVEQYLKEQKAKEKLDRIDRILDRVKEGIVKFVGKIGGKAAAAYVEDKITRVKLFRNYKSNPDLLFTANMSMSSDEEAPMVLVGLERLASDSEHNIFFTLSHEVGHFLNNIGLRSTFPPLRRIESCIDEKFGKMKVGRQAVNQEEIWADWVGHGVYFDSYLSPMKATNEEKLEGMKNISRTLCAYGGSSRGHPPNSFRANFMLGHPELKSIACKGVDPDKRRKQEYCGVEG